MEGAKFEPQNGDNDVVSSEEREIEMFFEDLAQRQKNLLPPDLITNDRHTDDVLWHGPAANSPIQRAGVAIFGIFFIIASIALSITIFDVGGFWGLVVPAVFAAVGLRMLYKSIVGRKTRVLTED